MQDQLSNQAESQIVSQSIPQLQRITYRRGDAVIRDDETNPTLTEVATDMEQHYLPLERLHNVGLHGWGIAAGLQVAFTPHQTGVTVRPGIALDSHGLHILLVAHGQADISLQSDGPGVIPLVPVSEQGVLVPTDTLTGDQFLVIRFFETVDRANFCTHTPWVHFVTPADLPTDGSSVILARMAFDSGSNKGQVLAVSQGARQGTGGHVEQAYDFNIQRPAVLGGLTVSATLNSTGITVFPGLALNAIGQYIFLNSGGQAEIGPNADAPNATPMLVDVSDDGILIPTDGLTGSKMLTIQPWETPAELTLPIPPNTLQTAPMRFRYTPRLQLVDASDFTFVGANVILAGITFGSGGVVTSLNANERFGSALSTGGFHVLKNTVTSPSENNLNVLTGEVGAIVPMSNGLALTVSNAEGEIHLNAASVQIGGDLVVGGGITTSRDITVESAVVNDSLSVGGTTVVQGALNVAEILNVTTEAHILGDTNLEGALTVAGTTTANGNVTANGSLTVTGLTVANGDLTTSKALTANGPIIANGGITTPGDITATQVSADFAVQVGGGPLFDGRINVYQSKSTTPAIRLMTDNNGGSITVNGPIFKNGGGFIIPHPLFPEQKTLTHSFVESPDMKNIYDGIAILDGKGEATIEMPAWFMALNSDIRYQLTCIGDYAPVYIAREMQDNNFTIAGGRPEMKVSWQVTGIRQDTWARENRFKVEEDK
ncbi:hypothetical protein KSF_004010 [Reticulibacter mediterranei]|uniref:Uncharacterized protein n=1 Tax=Reticulibacter mediterranei TaxID=2778369 RepID=A0A8J3MZE0_9CHLR|nr:hypothetical protein [Reticulibacter mediterranei]GHO90353.1 hypothetical protein KSF_004010 [Reticulibacter mediterranei]